MSCHDYDYDPLETHDKSECWGLCPRTCYVDLRSCVLCVSAWGYSAGKSINKNRSFFSLVETERRRETDSLVKASLPVTGLVRLDCADVIQGCRKQM